MLGRHKDCYTIECTHRYSIACSRVPSHKSLTAYPEVGPDAQTLVKGIRRKPSPGSSRCEVSKSTDTMPVAREAMALAQLGEAREGDADAAVLSDMATQPGEALP